MNSRPDSQLESYSMADESKQSSASRSAAASASGGSGGSNEFVRKLFTMLEDPSYKAVVRWSDTGDSFVVLDTNEFTKSILPRHFKHSNFASFVRQLNKYDFHKIRANESGTTYGDNAWQFKHPDFQINKKNQIDSIRRKTTSTRKVTTQETTPTVSQDYIKNLEADTVSMRSELKALKADLLEFKTLTSSLQASLNSLQESHSVTLHKLATLQSSNKVSNEVLRKLLVMETSQAMAHEKHMHVLDLLQHLNTSESTRNDNPYLHSTGVNNTPSANNSAATNAFQYNSHTSHYNTNNNNNNNVNNNNTQRQHKYNSFEHVKKSPSLVSASPPLSRYAAGVLASGSNNQNASRYTVLLVDDDDVSVRKIRKTLQDYGCDVDVANDGVDAWRRAEANTYDLVLMDLVIPSLDGVAAAAQMRKSQVSCPIIAMANSPQQALPAKVEQYRLEGISDVILKPFKKDTLNSFLKRYLPSASSLPALSGMEGTGNEPLSSTPETDFNYNSSNKPDEALNSSKPPDSDVSIPPLAMLNPLNLQGQRNLDSSPHLGNRYAANAGPTSVPNLEMSSQHASYQQHSRGHRDSTNSGTSLLAEAAATVRRHSSVVSDKGMNLGPMDHMSRHNSTTGLDNPYGPASNNPMSTAASHKTHLETDAHHGSGSNTNSSNQTSSYSVVNAPLNSSSMGRNSNDSTGISLPPPPPLHSHPHHIHSATRSPHMSQNIHQPTNNSSVSPSPSSSAHLHGFISQEPGSGAQVLASGAGTSNSALASSHYTQHSTIQLPSPGSTVLGQQPALGSIAVREEVDDEHTLKRPRLY